MLDTRIGINRGPFGVFYGWWMVGAGAMIIMAGAVQQSTVTVFFLPLAKELNLSYAGLSLVFSLARLEGGLEGPAVGWFIDRMGPRLPIIVGALLGGIGFLLLSTVDSYWGFLIVYMGLVSIGFHMGFMQCMHAAANLWFVRYRTRAMGVFSASFRLGAALLTPIVSLIVLTYGWRTGAMFAGALVLSVVLPFSYFIRRSPESMGLLPDGVRLDEAEAASEQSLGKAQIRQWELPVDFTLKEAMGTQSYWIIAFSTAVRLSTQSAIAVHFVPIFVWKGLGQQMGANMVALIAFIATPLILITAWMGDRWSKPLILLVGQLSVALAALILVYANSTWPYYLFVVLFAFGSNTSPVNYSILGDYYGRRAFATLRGALNLTNMIGVATPVFAGWIFDSTQSYTIALLIFSALAGSAAVLLLFLRRPQKKLPVPGVVP